MSNILDKIITKIKEDEEYDFQSFDPSRFTLESREIQKIPIGETSDFFLISEIKKASPSKGIIRKNFDPVAIAKAYTEAGTGAISVITEKNFFEGEKENLEKVRTVTEKPLLRKDFIIHPRQVYEAFNLGADMVLLIVACLKDEELKDLYHLILDLGMTPLIEIRNEEELDRILPLSPKLIGVNNRDLKTFEVDIQISLDLKPKIPADINVISESGIFTADHIQLLKDHGFAGALIGESLLRQKDLVKAIKNLNI